jgi:hypothetical protein
VLQLGFSQAKTGKPGHVRDIDFNRHETGSLRIYQP